MELLKCFFLTAKIYPVVKNQHLLLCTLLIGNSLAMEVRLASNCLFDYGTISRHIQLNLYCLVVSSHIPRQAFTSMGSDFAISDTYPYVC